MNIKQELSKIAKSLIAQEDSNEDIAYDVASRIVNKNMTPQQAFADIGYGDLLKKMKTSRLSYGWEKQPIYLIVRELKKELDLIRKVNVNVNVKYKIVYRDSNNQFKKEMFNTEQQLKDALKKMGSKQTGVETSKYVREELRGKPVFDKFLGPMWDGDSIRYEDQSTYDSLSK